jgi:hypothetical protein
MRHILYQSAEAFIPRCHPTVKQRPYGQFKGHVEL